ncbi:acetate--CoA ligase [Parenemella sanctibonifatiensis]|uniref:Acetyl-coenzyme A synthetase n=1 Tax=Parenemella sanctibonifatiensis TaxID=2016505 RepID=A0A255E0P9_9ACTN|nr:acetate--CoA ligase [Parenemella sanctibonifatiensis]OYN84581.1 acetate--CoA ligase [Parenemella sanctibonifatiensis]
MSEQSSSTPVFDPPAELAANANVTAQTYETAAADPEAFWVEAAKRLSWDTEPTEGLNFSNPPFATWFADGKLNAAYNCLDRHVEAGNGDRVAFHWIGEPENDTRDITYAQLTAEVSQAANALTELGVKAGDRVAIYMPMIPEAVVAMLACARIGAPHVVVFAGFSADALSSRINDCDCQVVITADGQYRRGKPAGLKPAVDEALKATPGVRNVLVVQRTGQETAMEEGRDLWWHDVVGKQSTEHTPQAFDAEHPLYVMYTSGSTGKPKGILHTTGGYLTGVAYTHWATFDLKPDTDIFWTAADIGWVTGHSYLVYGPLANGTTSVMYEGTPDTPHQGRWWEIIQQYKVTILYCAPTAIRTFMKWGEDIPAKYDLSSLRLLGSVGEPINPEAYLWYRKHIGSDQCPVADTWWQTETGQHLITPMPGVSKGKPGAALTPFPGISAEIVNDEGQPVGADEQGYLVITQPWPAMLRTLWGDDQRYQDTYWSRFPGKYFAGDGAKYDADGDVWLLGRVDDVMNISGHRLSTAEIESALVSHPTVAEAAVVGASDATTGQAIVAFVILRSDAAEHAEGEELIKELRNHVAKEISPIAKPRQIMIVEELPKTRSGKIMRRLLRDVAENRELGDVTTLTDSSVMSLIKEGLSSNTSSED